MDVSVVPRLDIAVRPASARKHANCFAHLLLQVKAHARAKAIGAHGDERVAGVAGEGLSGLG